MRESKSKQSWDLCHLPEKETCDRIDISKGLHERTSEFESSHADTSTKSHSKSLWSESLVDALGPFSFPNIEKSQKSKPMLWANARKSQFALKSTFDLKKDE